MVAAVVLAALLGVVAGAGVARWVSSRSARSAPVAGERTDGPSGDDDVSVTLREAVEHLEIGVLVTDASGRIAYRNAAAQVYQGTHVGILIDDQVAQVASATRSGGRTSDLVELQGPPKLWLEISAEPVPSGGAVVTIRDVSERVRTDAMRTDFVTNISHELKTPVGAVAVLAEALMDESDPAVVQRLSDHLVDEAHRAVRTIDDLLKLSEIESRRPGDEIVDVGAVVEGAMARGRAVDGGRGVEVTLLDVPAGLHVRGDELQLASAIGNLVENAV